MPGAFGVLAGKYDKEAAWFDYMLSAAVFFINLMVSWYSISWKKSKQVLDEAELALLKEGLKRTYKERFEMATRLYKIQLTIKKTVISHKPFVIIIINKSAQYRST